MDKNVKPKYPQKKLATIDGQDYAAYQSLLGTYDFNLFKLIIQQIPKDPYAPPHTGIYRIQVQRKDNRIIRLKIESKVQRIAYARISWQDVFSMPARGFPKVFAEQDLVELLQLINRGRLF